MQNVSDLNNIIVFDKVSKIFSKTDVALSDVSFAVREGEFVCLIGASGSGKSTLLEIIAGLDVESSGKVIKPENISMAFQGAALFPWLTVFENIALGLRARKGKHKVSEVKIREQVGKYASMLSIDEHLSKYPPALSGGQRQRVGIARALAVEPAVLLLDEPFSALDPKTTAELHDDILKLWKETKKTILLVSHSIDEAVSLAERVILIKDHTISKIFDINLPYPRREQEGQYEKEVLKVRKEFFA